MPRWRELDRKGVSPRRRPGRPRIYPTGEGRFITKDTFAAVIRQYIANPKFRKLEQTTQSAWERELWLAELPETLGGLHVDQIEPADVQAFLDELADRPGKQATALTALRAVEKFAIVKRLLPRQITLGVELIGPAKDSGHKPWTEQDLELALREAPPEVSRALALLSATGQRGGDVVRMRWNDLENYNGRLGINLTTQKTTRRLWVPFTNDFADEIGTWKPRTTNGVTSPHILLTLAGVPWTRNALTVAWNRQRKKNPKLRSLAHLHLHGLRATAVVRLLRAGATELMITELIGMSAPMVKRYSRHSRQRENASAAIVFLDAAKAKKRNHAE